MNMIKSGLLAACLLAAAAAQTQCPGYGSVAQRFFRYMQAFDQDGDGLITAAEVYANFRSNKDKDRDGCVSLDEWVRRFVDYEGFSETFAHYRFPRLHSFNTSDPRCPVRYAHYRTENRTLVSSSEFLNNDIQSLIDMCYAVDSDPTQPQVNCDCIAVQAECRSSYVIKGTAACQNYVNVMNNGQACDGKGKLITRFDKNIFVNDADNDGVVTGPEIYEDLRDNYDVNSDGCVSADEWLSRWTNYFRFSRDFALARWAPLISTDAACPIRYAPYQTDTTTKFPVDVFLNTNLQILVDYCMGNQTLSSSNCDCAQLPTACRGRYAGAAACAPLTADPVVG